MHDRPVDLAKRLQSFGQEHLLADWDRLEFSDRRRLVEQLEQVDFVELKRLYDRRNESHTALPTRERIEPIPVESRNSVSSQAIAIGEAALRRGEVAVLLVAGGQASRLGTDRPKGVYPVGPVSGASLFQIHAEKVLALRRRYDASIPFLIMTSPATHAATESFFAEKNHFGLELGTVTFFQQGTMPALDLATGRVLLEKPGSLFLAPNGHGGTLTALADSGILATLKANGIRHVFYFQIDNPLVRVADPAFLGRHIESQSEVSSKVIFKTDPAEKVGILAVVDGRCSIIEYSDLPADMARERGPSGDLLFRAGSPAIHLFSLPFLERITSGATRLDYHIARKKVPCLDSNGRPFIPSTENALKFELFIFDALPMADRWLAMEVSRDEEFAPLKNATGPDSPETVRQLMIADAARTLERSGITVPYRDGAPAFPLEISPLFALDEIECRSRIPNGFEIQGPTYLSR